MQIFKLFLSLFVSFLLTGCKEDFPTYASFCSQDQQTFECLHYAVLDGKDKRKIADTLNIKDMPMCPYRVELTKYHVGACNNPVVKSFGGDFNGYVRLEIKKGFKCYYKVQSDYKNDENAAFERVLSVAKKDITRIK